MEFIRLLVTNETIYFQSDDPIGILIIERKVEDMEMPVDHSTFAIVSVKHDGSFHRSWEENTILYQDQVKVIGYNHKTLVKEAGSTPWHTKEPAIFYFDRRYWFNIIFLWTDVPFYYCNMSSPCTYNRESGVLQYVDYDIDVLVQQDGTYEIVDEKEYEENCQYYAYPSNVQQQITKQLDELIKWITTRQGPFQHDVMQQYIELYKQHDREK